MSMRSEGGASNRQLEEFYRKDIPDTNLKVGDFIPFGKWEPDHPNSPVYMIDKRTGRKYYNHDIPTLWIKNLGSLLITVPVHSACLIANIAYRIFLICQVFVQSGSFQAKLQNSRKDGIKIAFSIVALLGLTVAGLLGLLLPREGAKLTATWEKAAYGRSIYVPCFHPQGICGKAPGHLFGGDKNNPNAF